MTPQNPSSKPFALPLVLFGGAFAVGIAAFTEILLGMPAPAWVYGLLALLISLPLFLRPRPISVASAVVFLACLLGLHFVPWNGRKPFLRQLSKVRPGMSEAQVCAIMAGYKDGTGWPAPPDQPVGTAATLQEVGSGTTLRTTTDTNGNLALADSLVFRHSSDGRFNSDWGVIGFKNGRVTRVQFMPD